MNEQGSAYPLLEKITFPADLRALPEEQLQQVCAELRDFIIDVVSVKGGHFGASLGVVELTVALHYVFNTPYDQLVWDVGHQAYGHKILTGRRSIFHTNRLHQGISGFPKRSESEYDTFGVGHSSTSIGAALGMAVGSRLQGEKDRQTVAVIGDGAMTAGMAFEALNHAGAAGADMLVVLNDNCMSIDPNVGALKEYLTDITTSHTYNKVKDEVWHLLGKISKFGPNAQAIAQKVENAIKAAVLEGANPPEWKQLFVQGVANYLEGFSGAGDLTAERALELEDFMTHGGAGIRSFFRRMASANIGEGMSAIVDALSGDESSEPDVFEQAAEAAQVTPQEHDWLDMMVEQDGEIDEYERALLSFLAENSHGYEGEQ